MAQQPRSIASRLAARERVRVRRDQAMVDDMLAAYLTRSQGMDGSIRAGFVVGLLATHDHLRSVNHAGRCAAAGLVLADFQAAMAACQPPPPLAVVAWVSENFG